jgi:hypothetical protein
VSTALLLAGAVLSSGESKKSGPIGFAVILVLCVACYFLFKSMSKHLRKVREEFPVDERDDSVPPTEPLVKRAPDLESPHPHEPDQPVEPVEPDQPDEPDEPDEPPATS